MATTDVDICNSALVKIGKPATITSLTDGSVAANNCAALYSISLNTVLAEHAWSFATVTSPQLPLVDNPNTLWTYAYQAPGDVVSPLAVYAFDAQGDVMGDEGSKSGLGPLGQQWAAAWSHTTQQDFSLESDSNGAAVIYTNQANAILKYVKFVNNASGLPPLFVQALSCFLASQLAGAMIKGDVGVAAMQKILQAYEYWLGKAKTHDANNRVVHPQYVPSGVRARFGRGW